MAEWYSPEEIGALINAGESEGTEFLGAPSRKIAETMCAFANSNGGIVLVGVAGDGSVAGAGLTEVERLVEEYNRALFVPPGPESESRSVALPNGGIVAIRVARNRTGQPLQLLDGTFYIRQGATNQRRNGKLIGPTPTSDSRIRQSADLSEEGRRLYDEILNTLRTLPRWAVVAFAAKAAHRALPELARWGDPVASPHVEAIRTALQWAEDAASQGRTDATAQVHLEGVRRAQDQANAAVSAHLSRATRARAEDDSDEAGFRKGVAKAISRVASIAACVGAAVRTTHASLADCIADVAIAVATLYGESEMGQPAALSAAHVRDDLVILSHNAKSGKWDDRTRISPALLDAMSASREVSEALIPTPFQFRRRAADSETCLSLPLYLDVFQAILDGTQEEICLGVFGHWGRGKTHLVEELGKRVQQGGGCAVFFSAWRYPTVPELWVYLYETFADSANQLGVIDRIAVSVRTALWRRGMLPLFLLLVALASAITPLWQRIQLARFWLPLIGIAGGVLVLKYFFGLGKTVRQFLHEYMFLPRHAEGLGLQAVIGHDLKSLLRGWVRPTAGTGDYLRRLPGRHWVGIAFYIVGVLAVLAALRPHGGENPTIGLPGLGAVREYMPNMLSVALCIAWTLFAATMAWCVIKRGWQDKRILLIIDDLDRCRREQMLTVIESLKLMMEDQEVSSRLQVIMLVEEESLREAVVDRYRHLLTEGTSSPRDLSAVFPQRSPSLSYTRERVWRETLEKLFVAHVSLPPLSEAEIVGVMRALTQQRVVPDPPPSGAEADSLNDSGAVLAEATHVDDAQMPHDMSVVSPDAQLLRNTGSEKSLLGALSHADAKALVEIAPAFANSKWGIPCGPRTERNFACRYLIAKLMVLKLGVVVSPQCLAEALAYGAGYEFEPEHREYPETVQWVVRQLS